MRPSRRPASPRGEAGASSVPGSGTSTGTAGQTWCRVQLLRPLGVLPVPAEAGRDLRPSPEGHVRPARPAPRGSPLADARPQPPHLLDWDRDGRTDLVIEDGPYQGRRWDLQ